MTQQPKRSKGNFGVSVNRGCLRIAIPRFLSGENRKYLHLGLEDTPENRKFALAIASRMKSDLLYQRFDLTLQSYKPQKITETPQPQKTQTIAQLYQQYIETKRPTVRPGTWRGNYLVMLHHIQRSPFADVDPNLEKTGYAQKVLDWATQTLTPDTCCRLMVQLNACLKWSIESGRVNLNRSPFEGMATKAKKLIKKSEDEETDINPFTRSERDTIIEAFKTSSHHCNYYYYVVFCFYVGCRPSEAIALTWNDVASDLSKITFRNAIVASVGGTQKCSGLKTQSRRVFPCNRQVQELLKQMQSTCQSGNSLVFTSAKGEVFSTGYFRRVWVKILNTLRIEYRKPYQTRHTFITLCLEAGVDAKDIAKWVGNSAEIIYRHYGGHRTDLSVPEI